MDTEAWKILADLLERASDEFRNHGCNDYEIPNSLANREMMVDAARWNSSNPYEWELNISPDGTKIYVFDYFLMGYFAHKAKELAGIE